MTVLPLPNHEKHSPTIANSRSIIRSSRTEILSIPREETRARHKRTLRSSAAHDMSDLWGLLLPSITWLSCVKRKQKHDSSGTGILLHLIVSDALPSSESSLVRTDSRASAGTQRNGIPLSEVDDGCPRRVLRRKRKPVNSRRNPRAISSTRQAGVP